MTMTVALLFLLTCSLICGSIPAHAGGTTKFPGRGSVEDYNKSCRLSNQAIELAKRGDYVGAVRLDREAIVIYPHSAATYHNLGNHLEKLGKLDEAVKEQQRAIDKAPDMLAAWLALGFEFEMQHKFKDAERCYRKSVRLSQFDYGALGCLGDILRKQRKFEEARFWLLKAKASPGSAASPGEIEKKLAQCDRKDASD
ncbi:MAG: tetratricopeptide repeat protein [Candidatus Obscuribacterales bacterium]|nr:tetratricopeptide repeat protein [Candidatus Obscuribacterales bacterium]